MNDPKNAEQDGGTWPSWLYSLWGPASTGRIARQHAIEIQQAKYAKAEWWRAEAGRIASDRAATAATSTVAPAAEAASAPAEKPPA